ncbi:MAG: hypothetical protein WAM97_02205, partial [Acidimicrobiales bacterium]
PRKLPTLKQPTSPALPQQPLLHISLPRAGALTDLLLAPVQAAPDEKALNRARNHVVYQLQRASIAMSPGSQIRIDPFRIEKVLATPYRPDPDDGAFSPSPAACRRAIGTEAVALCQREIGVSPAQAVSRILDSAQSPGTRPAGSTWWHQWFRRLAFGAKVTVQAESTTWATQMRGALDWERFETEPVIGRDYRWECPGSKRITIHAKVDVCSQVEGRPVFFLVSTGVANEHWTASLALPALCAGLVGGAAAVPARVVGLWPASGQVRAISLDDTTIEMAAKAVATAGLSLARFGRQAGNRPQVERL